MAEKQDPTLKKISEQLTCPVCLEAYKEPKVLNCHHVFCHKCLEGLAGGGDTLICPTCREETTVPNQAIGKLKPAFHIHSLFDIKDTLLGQQPSELATDSKQVASDATPVSRREHCPTHPGRSLEMYCQCCSQRICCACIVNEHKSHTVRLIADVLQQERESVALHRKMLEQQLQVVGSIAEKVELETEQIKHKQNVIKETIQHAFELFQKVLNSRQQELVDNLNDLTQVKLDTLAAKRTCLEKVKTNTNQQLGSIEQAMQSENVTDVMAAKKRLVEELERASTETTKLLGLPPVDPNMNFFFDQSDIESLSTVGKIYAQSPCAKNSLLQVTDTATVLELGGTFSVLLDIKDQYGASTDAKTSDVKGEVIPCGLVARDGYSSDLVSVSKCSDGRYKVSSTPSLRGRHELEVKVHGEHVTGSPAQILVQLPPSAYCSPVNCVKGLHTPWGVAINSKDHVIVTENASHRLLFFNEEAEKVLQTVGRKGVVEHHFHQPACVFVDQDDYIYLTEHQTFAVKKCSTNGIIINSVGAPGKDPLRFMSPMGISVNPLTGRVFVADMENNRIQVLNPDLTFNRIVTGSADGQHRIRLPSDIAFESDGTMFVTDNEHHCIQVYSATCDYLRTIGRKGKHRGQLALPFGICLDGNGHIFVAEAFNDRVSIFKTSGKFVHSFGSHGTQPGQFNKPQKIAMDKAGHLYVTDSGNNRLQVFNTENLLYSVCGYCCYQVKISIIICKFCHFIV